MEIDVKNRIEALDGVRGLAILIVLYSHAGELNLFFYNSSGTGWVGVYLFFILSAFLLDTQIIKFLSNDKTISSNRFWSNYFLRRFLRIFPLFLLALLVNFFLERYRISPFIPVGGGTGVIDHLLLQKGVNVFWSIAVEFKYYFFSPILILVYRLLNWNFKKITLLTIVLLIASEYFYYNIDSRISTFRHLNPFLFGSYLAYINYHRKDIVAIISSFKIVNIVGLIPVLIIFSLVPSFYDLDRNYFHIINTLINACWTLLILMLLSGSAAGYANKIFKNKLMTSIGKASFSIYLFHINISYFIKSQFGEVYEQIPLIIMGIAFISFISYKLVEKPLQRFRINK